MNRNAERALRRLLPFRLGSQGFPRARAAAAAGGRPDEPCQHASSPQRGPPTLRGKPAHQRAAEAPGAVRRGLGRAGRQRRHGNPALARAPEPLTRARRWGWGKRGPGGPRGKVGRVGGGRKCTRGVVRGEEGRGHARGGNGRPRPLPPSASARSSTALNHRRARSLGPFFSVPPPC